MKGQLAGLRLTRRGENVVAAAKAVLWLPVILMSLALWGAILGAVIGR